MSACPDNEDAGSKLANLARLLVRNLQLMQQLREEAGRADEVIRVAIGEIANRNRALDRARDQVAHLRLEVRTLRSGRTTSQLRQAEESGSATADGDVAA